MTKICAFCVTAFYLILTSGQYECILHCTADYLFSEKTTVAKTKQPEADNKKDADEDSDGKCGADCTCCYHHGTYIVRENFNAFVDFQLSAIQIYLAPPSTDKVYFIPKIIKSSVDWPRATGPPFISGTSIYIANQTFLI